MVDLKPERHLQEASWAPGASPLGVHLLPVTCRPLLLSSAALCRAQGLGEGRSWGGKSDRHLTSLTGPSGLVPRTPDCSLSKAPRLPAPWSTCSQHPPSSLVGEDAQSCLGQAGILTEGTDRAVTPDIRWVPGGHVHLPALLRPRVWVAQPQMSRRPVAFCRVSENAFVSVRAGGERVCAQSTQGPGRGLAGAGEGPGGLPRSRGWGLCV